MPKISVIIPCYNAERYVDRCINCLLAQTIGFDNLEVIVVNDGSLDHTMDKWMHWEQAYPGQIILIDCETNRGQGAAKNTGISYASAEYLGFLDVDDVIADAFYEKLYDKILEGYDWTGAKFLHLEPEEQPDFGTPQRKADQEFHCLRGESFLYKDYAQGSLNGEFGILPARLFRRDFILEHGLFFPEGVMYEDNFWGVKCDVFSKHVYILDEPLYCYYKNENSVVSSRNTVHHLDRMKIEEMVLGLLREQGLFETYYEEIEWRFIRMYFCGTWLAIFLKMDTIPDVLPLMRRRIYELFPDFRKNPNIRKFSPLDQALLKLLDLEDACTVEELSYIKEGYIKDFMRMYEHAESSGTAGK